MNIYADNILDHYKHPRGQGEMAHPTVEHEEVNHSCGDALKVQLKIKDGVIEEVLWTGTGCAISQAGMSIIAEDLHGKKTAAVSALSKEDMIALLGVPVGPRRFKCALLPLHTLKNAIRKAEGKAPQTWIETVGTDEE